MHLMDEKKSFGILTFLIESNKCNPAEIKDFTMRLATSSRIKT